MFKLATGKRERFCPTQRANAAGPYLRAWLMLRNHGVLPVSGGWLDQTQAFIDAVAIANTEAASYG